VPLPQSAAAPGQKKIIASGKMSPIFMVNTLQEVRFARGKYQELCSNATLSNQQRKTFGGLHSGWV